MVGSVGPTFTVGWPMTNIGTTFHCSADLYGRPADDKHRHYIPLCGVDLTVGLVQKF
jgi:hypothetical protein